MNRPLKCGIGQFISVAVIATTITVFLVLIVSGGINEIHAISEGRIVNKYIGSAVDQRVFRLKAYCFTIEGEKRGKTVRYTFEVTENEYEAYKIGDWYER